MYAVGSAFYSQSIHEVAELKFQFILRFGLQVGDNGWKSQTQFFILCVSVWERWLAGKFQQSKLGEMTDLFYLPLARRTEGILQTF